VFVSFIAIWRFLFCFLFDGIVGICPVRMLAMCKTGT